MGIVEGWRSRRILRKLLAETPPDRSVLELQPGFLVAQGIRALALDFDGVLAPHGADKPLPEVESWLRQVVAVLGGCQVVILSNRPEGPRVDWFREQFPHIRFVTGVRKKPYPDGLKKTGELTGVPLSAVLMADDRLLTGCLAAVNAGCIPFYIRHPYIELRRNFRKELFFMLLRGGERLFVRLLP